MITMRDCFELFYHPDAIWVATLIDIEFIVPDKILPL